MLLAAAADEIGVRPVSVAEAHWSLACEASAEILRGAVTPYEGARRISADHWEPLGHPDELAGFVSEASEWEDHVLTTPLRDPGLRDEIERRIRGVALALLDSHRPE